MKEPTPLWIGDVFWFWTKIFIIKICQKIMQNFLFFWSENFLELITSFSEDFFYFQDFIGFLSHEDFTNKGTKSLLYFTTFLIRLKWTNWVTSVCSLVKFWITSYEEDDYENLHVVFSKVFNSNIDSPTSNFFLFEKNRKFFWNLISKNRT